MLWFNVMERIHHW